MAAQKNATPSREQQDTMRRSGLKPWEWTVVKELRTLLIIRNRVTMEIRMIDKK